MIIKKGYETIREKISGYESVAKYYEKNRGARFQTKRNLIKIVNEINLELEKKQTKEDHIQLDSLYNKLGRFI